MADLQQLELIYQEYEEKLSQAEKEAGLFAGAFNMGDDPRKDACNQVFYENVGNWVRSFLEGNPSPEEAARAAAWILGYPASHRQSGTYWMTYAAQGHAGALIPLLEQKAAEQLRKDFEENYPRRDRMPVQQQLMEALSGKLEKKSSGQGRGLLKIWLPRVVLLLIGLTVAHLGVSLFLLANLGSDPFNVMIQGLHNMIPG